MPQNFPYNGQILNNDIAISENNPGLQFNGTETNGVYFENREVAGTFYLAQNASYNTFSGQWVLVDSTKPAYAISTKNGTTQYLYSPAGTTPFSSWTAYAGVSSGIGVPTATLPAGSLYLRTDGASGARVYVSAGSGTWNAIAGV